MTVYKLINPSDSWTFLAPSDKIAFLISLIVGRGQTPAERDGWSSPFYFGKGADPEGDYQKQFNEPMEGAIDRNRSELIESLKSFMIHRDRSPEVLTGEALDKWNDKHRSSMNDFGGYAFEVAKKLSEKVSAG